MNKNKIVYENWTFQGNDFKDGNMFLATSLLSSQLQVNSFEATVKSSDPSIINFERNSKLIYYYDNRQQGIFYVQDIERAGPDTYKISATSTLGLLTEGKHYGGIYTGQTAQEIISDICGSVPFIIKNNMAGTKLYGWLPIAAPRDNLSQVLFALGAALKTDLDGVLRIAGLWDGVSGTVGRDELYQDAKVEYSAKVTQVVLTEHQYSEGGDTKKLFDGTAQAGDIITFNEPMHSLTADGFTILESGANYAKVSAGSGTLTGKEYVHNTRLVTRNVQTANTPNIKTVDKATLVSLVNSAAVADRLAAFYKCTETIDAPVVYKGEDTGNVMSVYHPYDRRSAPSCLQSADITLSGTLKAQEKSLVGFDPLQSDDTVLVDYHELITSSGPVTLPEGAESIRIVLIGGGTGGQAGKKGKDGTKGQDSFASSSTANVDIKYGDPGNGGEGGIGGAGGSGGKAFLFEIKEKGPMTLSVSIGGGGIGGASNEAAGSAGGDTTVTVNGETYSSASGTSSPGGYLDIIDNVVYAAFGEAGLPGAKGGKGGVVTDPNENGGPGEAGEPCGSNTGGSGGTGGRGANSSKKIWVTCGGGGGGAARNANGNPGENATRVGYSGAGGTGATGTKPDAETRPGFGGSGGNGGGGGGGGGGTCTAAANGGSTSTDGGPAGVGGNGGPGGDGAPGCVIIYYGMKKAVPVVYEDQSETVTESGAWVVPRGVTRIRAVLIGGGNGGTAGGDGTSGTSGNNLNVNTTIKVGSEGDAKAGAGGAGGAAGIPGFGGKVNTVEFKLQETTRTIEINIGSAGLGAENSETQPTEGGDTTLKVDGSTFSSADGARSDNGYVDIVSGKIYAKAGEEGHIGGGGGNGWGNNGTATDGEGVYGYTGGKNGGAVYTTEEVGELYVPYGSSRCGGSGAVYGKNGTPGYKYNDVRGSGGDAPSPLVPATPKERGTGGGGGNGGAGGGGGGGAGYGAVYGTHGYTESWSKQIKGGYGGYGSKGSKGGDGAPGCVIFYYSVPRKIPSGQLVDKNNCMVLDRLGRRIIT